MIEVVSSIILFGTLFSSRAMISLLEASAVAVSRLKIFLWLSATKVLWLTFCYYSNLHWAKLRTYEFSAHLSNDKMHNLFYRIHKFFVKSQNETLMLLSHYWKYNINLPSVNLVVAIAVTFPKRWCALTSLFPSAIY